MDEQYLPLASEKHDSQRNTGKGIWKGLGLSLTLIAPLLIVVGVVSHHRADQSVGTPAQAIGNNGSMTELASYNDGQISKCYGFTGVTCDGSGGCSPSNSVCEGRKGGGWITAGKCWCAKNACLGTDENCHNQQPQLIAGGIILENGQERGKTLQTGTTGIFVLGDARQQFEVYQIPGSAAATRYMINPKSEPKVMVSMTIHESDNSPSNIIYVEAASSTYWQGGSLKPEAVKWKICRLPNGRIRLGTEEYKTYGVFRSRGLADFWATIQGAGDCGSAVSQGTICWTQVKGVGTIGAWEKGPVPFDASYEWITDSAFANKMDACSD